MITTRPTHCTILPIRAMGTRIMHNFENLETSSMHLIYIKDRLLSSKVFHLFYTGYTLRRYTSLQSHLLNQLTQLLASLSILYSTHSSNGTPDFGLVLVILRLDADFEVIRLKESRLHIGLKCTRVSVLLLASQILVFLLLYTL